jgi:hypothetical protein
MSTTVEALWSWVSESQLNEIPFYAESTLSAHTNSSQDTEWESSAQDDLGSKIVFIWSRIFWDGLSFYVFMSFDVVEEDGK